MNGVENETTFIERQSPYIDDEIIYDVEHNGYLSEENDIFTREEAEQKINQYVKDKYTGEVSFVQGIVPISQVGWSWFKPLAVHRNGHFLYIPKSEKTYEEDCGVVMKSDYYNCFEELPKKEKSPLDSYEKEIKKFITQGKSRRFISKKMNVLDNQLREWLEARDLKSSSYFRKQFNKLDPHKVEIEKLIFQGHTQSFIAKQFNTKQRDVSIWLKNQEVSTKKWQIQKRKKIHDFCNSLNNALKNIPSVELTSLISKFEMRRNTHGNGGTKKYKLFQEFHSDEASQPHYIFPDVRFSLGDKQFEREHIFFLEIDQNEPIQKFKNRLLGYSMWRAQNAYMLQRYRQTAKVLVQAQDSQRAKQLRSALTNTEGVEHIWITHKPFDSDTLIQSPIWTDHLMKQQSIYDNNSFQ